MPNDDPPPKKKATLVARESVTRETSQSQRTLLTRFFLLSSRVEKVPPTTPQKSIGKERREVGMNDNAISSIFIVAPRGDVIIKREYRKDVPEKSSGDFLSFGQVLGDG